MSDSSKIARRDFLLGAAAGAASLAVPSHSIASSSRKLRYGIVGSGYRSRGAHLKILHDHVPQVEIVALCDITPENLKEGLQICGPATVGYYDYHKMLSQHPELDAVVVVVPNYKHAEVTIAALEAGKHVLTEKPMATHLADADRMTRAAEEHEKILQVGFQRRYANLFQRMHDLIHQDEIGSVEYVFASLFRGDWNPRSWKYTNPKTGERANWRFLTLTCGSALLEDGIHELDIIHWLVDAEPLRIEAVGGNNVFRDRETVDHAGVLIQFSNEVKCNFGFTIFTPGTPEGPTMRFFGSKAEMHPERDGHQNLIVIRYYSGRSEKVPVPDLRPEEESLRKNQAMDGHFDIETYREHLAFIRSMTTGEPPLLNGKVGKDAAHISLASERSLRTGNPVSWDDESL